VARKSGGGGGGQKKGGNPGNEKQKIHKIYLRRGTQQPKKKRKKNGVRGNKYHGQNNLGRGCEEGEGSATNNTTKTTAQGRKDGSAVT